MHASDTANQLQIFPYYLHIPDTRDLQRELRALIFFSEDQGEHHPGFGPPDLRLMVRIRDIKLSDKGHQERLHLDDTIKKPVFSVSRRTNGTNARESPSDAAPNTSGECRAE